MNPTTLYRPLSAAQEDIRILQVEPTLRQGLISCTLTHVSLLEGSAVPTFDAVSWCWGDPTQRKSIILNGVEVEIPRNAEEVLREVVHPNGIPRVWLDAVCINQDDLDERASQVSIMNQTFTKAQTVIAWLGQDGGNAPDAIRGVEALIKHCREHTSNLVDYDSTQWLRTGPRRGRYFTYESLPKEVGWSAITRLFSVPYLTRLWVIQEISLARRPTCYYGQYSFSWYNLGVAAEWMIHRSYQRDEYIGKFVRGIMNASIICNVRRGARNMDRLLMSSVHFDTSEPRDKIFGLLDLVQEDRQITPDYKQAIATVFSQATKSAIIADRRLWIIATITVVQGTESAGQLSELPSWVPQYASKWNKRPKGIRNFCEIGADNGKDMVIEDRSPLNILRVQGTVVATVASSTEPLTEEVLHDDAILSEFVNGLWAEIGRFNSEAPSPRALYDALTTWYQAPTKTLGYEEESLPADFNAFFEKCPRDLRDDRRKDSDEVELNGTAGSATAFRDHLRISSFLRSFFVATDGSAGQAIAQVQRGDKICILFGNDFPFVLRPVTDGYRLVGGAHLASVMNGSYVRDYERAGALKVEWFDIY